MLKRLWDLYESLRSWSGVYLSLDDMRCRACIMHGRSSSLWSFLTHSWYTDATNFRCWSEYTTSKLFWICSCYIHLFFILSRYVSYARGLLHDSLIASHIHVEMLDLSDTASATLVTQIFVLILKNNACYFINRFIALLSDVLNPLIYWLFCSEETPCPNLLLDRIKCTSLRAAGSIIALSSRSCPTTSLTPQWFIYMFILIVRYSLLNEVMRVCHRWGWRIIGLRTSWTRFRDTSCIFLKSFASVLLFCLVRVSSGLSLRLLGVFSAPILGTCAVLLLHQNFMNSLVLSLVDRASCSVVGLLKHASHDISVGTFDS